MMIGEKRPNLSLNADCQPVVQQEAGWLYALLTSKRSVSRRSRVTWYLRQLNKSIDCDHIFEDQDEEQIDEETPSGPEDESSSPQRQVEFTNSQDISLISMTPSSKQPTSSNGLDHSYRRDTKTDLATRHPQQLELLVTPNTRVTFLSKSIATSIILDLSPSVVSVSSQNGCVFLDSIFDALNRLMHLLIKGNEVPRTPYQTTTSPTYVLRPKVFISVIAYTPFVVVRNNQILVQNRRLSPSNIDQIIADIRFGLNRLTKEIQDLVSSTGGVNLEIDSAKSSSNMFVFPQPVSDGVIRHPEAILDDIFELGLFSCHLMPRLSRLSMVIISDGLLASTNNLNSFRLKSIAVSFISLGTEAINPDACFGYTPYLDLMRFVAKTTQGFCITHRDLIEYSQKSIACEPIQLCQNPLMKLFTCTLHTCDGDETTNMSPKLGMNDSMNPIKNEITDDQNGHFFSLDQADHTGSNQRVSNAINNQSVVDTWGGYHDWRSLRHIEQNLDADFEHVISCLLREGYLIKSIQIRHKESSWIVARLVLHWRHNLDLNYELTAQYWNNTDAYDLSVGSQLMLQPFNSTPIYGDTYCEITVHGSYNFLHNLCCDRRNIRRRSEYRDLAYRQFRQLIDGVLQTHERLQYLGRFYRDSSLSRVPSFLSHGNSLLYEQPHTHKLTSTIENIMDENSTNDFQEYWQKISCLDNKIWKNLMHTHTLRLILEHDQPKHKNIHCQSANGRYTHVQCRRALSSISTFIKTYASFALLEDTTYIRFINNREDELNQIDTSATKGFIVIRINKLLPIVVIHLMFTSGILDSQRIQIVNYLEEQLVNCKPCNITSSSSVNNADNLLKLKTIARTSEFCCALIRSPLERMLKVYSRNFAQNSLLHSWSHGLPGSWPHVPSHPIKVAASQQQTISQENQQSAAMVNLKSSARNENSATNANLLPSDSSLPDLDRTIYEYNLIYGKYLYGIRVVHTISNLPNEIIPLLVTNVLAKISAVLMNMHIKQGFHIAFNNSGILNLVLELDMRDTSGDDQPSSCLCQSIVFPPVATTSSESIQTSLLGGTTSGYSSAVGQAYPSVATLHNSYSTTDPGYHPADADFKTAQQEVTCSSSTMNQRIDEGNVQTEKSGELKLTREYWIEKKFGLTCGSERYHKTLHDISYSQVIDELFLMDSSVFDCLFAYELLQLMCDKQSAHHNLDTSMNRRSLRTSSISLLSPTTSINSSTNLQDSQGVDQIDGLDYSDDIQLLPSNFIDGKSCPNPRIPLLELDYRFSVTQFLDRCQQAAVKVLLFKDHSQFYGYPLDEPGKVIAFEESFTSINQNRHVATSGDQSSNIASNGNFAAISKERMSNVPMRRTSIDLLEPDVNNSMAHNGGPVKREHRLSGQQEFTQIPNSVASSSLNHLFLETLHKRLKQMHDKEIQVSDYDRQLLPAYLVRRCMSSIESGQSQSSDHNAPMIDWRCFLRKGNQENMLIVLLPASLLDVVKWLNYIETLVVKDSMDSRFDPVCPIFVFRCSSSMINDYITQTLDGQPKTTRKNVEKRCHSPAEQTISLESDLSLHFGQPCRYMDQFEAQNDELDSDISVQTNFLIANQTQFSDEKTLEHVHFRAFLRKIKNTVLKSRFSSLNDAYQNEIFIHRDDILYYINNVDLDTQKKYHVSLLLRNLSDFIKGYQDYNDSLPSDTNKNCNSLLNSILLQKCGLFINQPIARFDESDPLIKQMHDRKLLFFMRCNYKVDLPILSENLSRSRILKRFLVKGSHQRSASNNVLPQNQQQQVASQLSNSTATSNTTLASSPADNGANSINLETLSSSLNKAEGSKLLEAKYCSSLGATPGSLTVCTNNRSQYQQSHQQPMPRFTSNSSLVGSVISSWQSPADSYFLEAFRGAKYCAIDEISPDLMAEVSDISSRHEAHLAEVLKKTGQRKESHHYRRVLKSKANYSQSHGAIDQALRRVDSLGRLEHFCLTPLLFDPSWRSKLAPVRDHTIEQWHNDQRDSHAMESQEQPGDGQMAEEAAPMTAAYLAQQEAEHRWHQAVCNNYIKEYEQYIQTLGFNAVQIRYQSSVPKVGAAMTQTSGSSPPANKTPLSNGNPGHHLRSRKSSKTSNSGTPVGSVQQQQQQQQHGSQAGSNGSTVNLRRGSISTSNQSLPAGASGLATYNTGYLIKFMNSGCLVFKVGFCKPYVYSILYSIEGERFNNSNTKMSMTTFLDELDNIKVTMHLHSFTYDYHLRSMYSYISGRQMTFSPAYHLVSFLDDFIKYYQKAPNYARNHIICGSLTLTDTKVPGQQLFNHIVAHSEYYNLEVLEMSSSNSSILNSLINNRVSGADQNLSVDFEGQATKLANDYVLCELKREKVRYRDGKDPDIFDCGLLLTHNDPQNLQSSSGFLTLKYFLVLTNQRELYPKLIHTYDSIISSSGCHRPIRLGTKELARPQETGPKKTDPVESVVKTKQLNEDRATNSGQSDAEDFHSSDLLSSGEASGPQSIFSTTSSSSNNWNCQVPATRRALTSVARDSSGLTGPVPKIKVQKETSGGPVDGPQLSGESGDESSTHQRITNSGSSLEEASILASDLSLPVSGTNRKRLESTNSSHRSEATGYAGANLEPRAICDEEITYLGYFSSDEMDMLRFLREKTNNLHSQIEHLVKMAEINYQRDHLWQKLVQRSSSSSSPEVGGKNPTDELPLTTDELIQLLAIAEQVSLSSLDSQLDVFSTMPMNWYMSLLKSFSDLRQSACLSAGGQHRIIHIVKIGAHSPRSLLLYMLPKCASAIILLSIEPDRDSVNLSVLLKDKPANRAADQRRPNNAPAGSLAPGEQDKVAGERSCSSPGNKLATIGSGQQSAQQQQQQQQSTAVGVADGSSASMAEAHMSIELDDDCRQLINDFVNLCATFMWSTLL